MNSNSMVPAGDISWGAQILGLGGARLLLASRSPRRAGLLESLGVPFLLAPVDVDETLRPGESPHDGCRRLALEKARAAARVPDAGFILGADTMVVVDGRTLGKPRDAEEARDMLHRLSGRTHEVLTGVAILRVRDGAEFSGVETTRVRFGPLSADDIEVLVCSRDGEGKAGGYAVQGLAASLIESIDGDYPNVVGLPLVRLRRLLREAAGADPGVLVAIWRKRAHGGPMDPVPGAVLEAGQGLVGNADQGGRRQVTLIESEVFEAVSRELGVAVDPAARRANLLVRGIRLGGTRGRLLAVGPCRIRILGETRPCELMDRAVPGLRNALSPEWRAGAFGEVTAGGPVAPGDPVSWVED